MSMPRRDIVYCRTCGGPVNATIFQSVNTDYAENVPEMIKNREIFRIKCPKCGTESYLEYDMLYNDMKHNAMIWMIHPESKDYKKRVAKARDKRAFSLTKSMYKNTRLVSCVDELREKVTCLEMGRDDRIIELCKLIMIINAPEELAQRKLKKGFYFFSDEEEYISLIDCNKREAACCVLKKAFYDSVKTAFAEQLPDTSEIPFPVVDILWASNFLHNYKGDSGT